MVPRVDHVHVGHIIIGRRRTAVVDVQDNTVRKVELALAKLGDADTSTVVVGD